MKRKGRTSQRTILFRQNVNRDNEEWAHFLEGFSKSCAVRRAKPPHHRFKAAVRWTAVAVTVGVIGLGAIMSARTWQRRKELKEKYAPLIDERARLLGRP